MFTPSAIGSTHESQYLTAEPVTAVLRPSRARRCRAALDIQANEAFVDEVQRQVDEFLDECATQTVLLPTGCPFGETIVNRVVSDPVWSMVEYPAMTPRAVGRGGDLAGADDRRRSRTSWSTCSRSSTASISTLDEDVPFFVAYNVTFLPDDLLIQADYDP